jgi:hypothetical protein
MQKGVPITIYEEENSFRIAGTDGRPPLFFSTKKALLSAIDKHFVKSRKKDEINLVEEANRILAGPVAEETK